MFLQCVSISPVRALSRMVAFGRLGIRWQGRFFFRNVPWLIFACFFIGLAVAQVFAFLCVLVFSVFFFCLAVDASFSSPF